MFATGRLTTSGDRHRHVPGAPAGESGGRLDENLPVAGGADPVLSTPQVLWPGSGCHAQQVTAGVRSRPLGLCLNGIWLTRL